MKKLLKQLEKDLTELSKMLKNANIKCNCVKLDLWPATGSCMRITIWDGENHLLSPDGDLYINTDELLSIVHKRKILFKRF